MRCFDAKNNSFYVDENGAIMPVSENATSRVIVASGNIEEPRLGIEGDTLYNVVDSLFKMVEFIRKDTFLTAQIEQIYIEKNQDFTLIPKVGDTELIFGGLSYMEEKFRKLKIFYLEAMPYEGWRKYSKLNLKYKNQVVGVKN
jgi:cell division protein FtsQ